MTLKAVVENLDDVPENLREEYTEKDGKFFLDLDDTIKTHASVLPLSNALAREKKEKGELREKLTAANAKLAGLPEDFDPHGYQDVLNELETLKKDPNRDKKAEEGLQRQREQYEQRLRDSEAKRVSELAEKDDVIAKRDSEIESLVAGEGLTKALVKSSVAPHFLKAANSLLRGVVKMRTDEDSGERRAVVDTDLGEVSVEQYVESWTKSDEGKPFVVKPAGGGAPGSQSGGGSSSETNPWAKNTSNLTLQGQIIKTDRAKARRLMEAAGVPAHQISATLG